MFVLVTPEAGRREFHGVRSRGVGHDELLELPVDLLLDDIDRPLLPDPDGEARRGLRGRVINDKVRFLPGTFRVRLPASQPSVGTGRRNAVQPQLENQILIEHQLHREFLSSVANAPPTGLFIFWRPL